jgi:hypothetical protein
VTKTGSTLLIHPLQYLRATKVYAKRELLLACPLDECKTTKKPLKDMLPTEVPPDLVGQSRLYTHADPLIKR